MVLNHDRATGCFSRSTKITSVDNNNKRSTADRRMPAANLKTAELGSGRADRRRLRGCFLTFYLFAVGLLASLANVDPALEERAIFNGYARGHNVAGQ